MNPFRIRGYEKFWNALLAGNFVQVPIVSTLLLLSFLDPEFHPGLESVIAVVTVFWTALAAALGAYLADNTEEETKP